MNPETAVTTLWDYFNQYSFCSVGVCNRSSSWWKHPAMFLSHQGAWVSAEHLAVDAEQILHVSKGCDSCNSCWSTIHCWGVVLKPEPSQNGLGTRLIKMQWCANILWECATQSRDCTNFQIVRNIYRL